MSLSTRIPPPSASHILSLPMELLLLMSSHLSVQELSRLARTTKHLHSALNHTVCRRGLARGTVHVSSGGRRHQGCLPLVHWAVKHNHVRLLANLLAAGGSPHEMLCNGMTPLHRTSNLAMIRLLMAYRVDIDEPDHEGRTLLWKHVILDPKRHYNLDMAKELIALGANVNQRDAAGNSLLHCVLDTRYKYSHQSALHAMRLLLAHGADAGARNKCGQPPLASLELRWLHKKAIALLLTHGADVNHLRAKVDDALRKGSVAFFAYIKRPPSGGEVTFDPSYWKKKARMIQWLLKMGLSGLDDTPWRLLQRVAKGEFDYLK